MHPIDQTSTEVPYYLFLRSNSGARYQSVTTVLVIGFKGFSDLLINIFTVLSW